MFRSLDVIFLDLHETVIHQKRSEASHIACIYAALVPWCWELAFEDFTAAWSRVAGQQRKRVLAGVQLLFAGQRVQAREKLYEVWYRENIVALLRELKIAPRAALVEELTWRFQESWVAGLVCPAENVAVLKDLARQGYRLSIVTNFQQPDIVADVLAQFGLDGLFEPVVISAEAGVRKPHPDLFCQALEQLGLTDRRDRVLMVGDNPEDDVQGAIFAGVYPILLDIQDRHARWDDRVIRLRQLSALSESLEALKSYRTFPLAQCWAQIGQSQVRLAGSGCEDRRHVC